MGLDMARGFLANTVIPCLRHIASPPMVDARLAREVGRPSRLARSTLASSSSLIIAWDEAAMEADPYRSLPCS